jgi:hypothetical protein
VATKLTCVALQLAAAGSVAAETSDLKNFLLTYRCAVVERLKVVHATVAPKDRFFIFSLKSERQAYVQCVFLPDEPRVLCEAASGFFLSKPGEPRSSWRVPPNGLTELGRLGFSTEDWDGNHQRMIDLGAKVDFVAIADLILSAIYHGYGARVGTPMEWKAPLVPKDDDSDQRCTPLG